MDSQLVPGPCSRRGRRPTRRARCRRGARELCSGRWVKPLTPLSRSASRRATAHGRRGDDRIRAEGRRGGCARSDLGGRTRCPLPEGTVASARFESGIERKPDCWVCESGGDGALSNALIAVEILDPGWGRRTRSGSAGRELRGAVRSARAGWRRSNTARTRPRFGTATTRFRAGRCRPRPRHVSRLGGSGHPSGSHLPRAVLDDRRSEESLLVIRGTRAAIYHEPGAVVRRVARGPAQSSVHCWIRVGHSRNLVCRRPSCRPRRRRQPCRVHQVVVPARSADRGWGRRSTPRPSRTRRPATGGRPLPRSPRQTGEEGLSKPLGMHWRSWWLSRVHAASNAAPCHRHVCGFRYAADMCRPVAFCVCACCS